MDDRTYFKLRAEVETVRAQQATHAAVVDAHNQFAEAYLQKVADLERPDEHQIVGRRVPLAA